MKEDPEGALHHDDDADPEREFAAFCRELDLVRGTARGHPLDETFYTRRGVQMSVRWVYVHMIEEYACHNSHADLLRERLDGATGY